MNSTLLARTRPDLLDDQAKDNSILGSTDTLMATVPWGNWRSGLVYQRKHAGRTWLRLRTFNKHRTKGCWYPSPRFFVIPMEHAADLASAIESAAQGAVEPEPDWYPDFVRQYDESRAGRDAEHFARAVKAYNAESRVAAPSCQL